MNSGSARALHAQHSPGNSQSLHLPAEGAPLGGKTERQRAETQASPAHSGWAPHLLSKHFAERIKGPCTGSRVPDGSGGAGFPEAGTYRATLLSPSS